MSSEAHERWFAISSMFLFNAEAKAETEFEAGYPALPSALGAALGDPVSLLALEDGDGKICY